MSTLPANAAAAPLTWLAGAHRRLEDSHALLGWIFIATLGALLTFTALDKVRSGKQDFDQGSIQIAAGMLAMPKSTSIEIGAPGYPLVLYGVARIDQKLATAIACRTKNASSCHDDASFASIVALQIVVSIAALILVLLLALRLSGSWEAALLTLLLTCLGSRFGAFASSISPLTWTLALTLLYSLLALEAYLRRSTAFALAAGIAAGASVLFSPLTVAAVPGLAVALALMPRGGRPHRRFALVAAYIGGVAALAVLAAFAQMLLGYDPDASVRLLAVQLSERIGYQTMGITAWIAGLILPIPIIGGFLEFLFPDSVADQLAHGYAAAGRSTVFPHALAQPGPAAAQYWWLLKTHVVNAFGQYLAVTPQILNRGIWGGADIVALVGIFNVKRLFVLHHADDRIAALLVVLLPALSLLAASVALTSNQFPNVPLLPFVYAYAMAYVVARFPSD